METHFEDAPSHYTAMLRHRNLLFRRWASLEDIVTGKAGIEGHAHRPNLTERGNENFIRAMYAVTREIASAVVDRLDLRDVRTIAGLGGGPGVYLEEICRRRPDIQAYLVDLPITLDVARRILAGSEAAKPCRSSPGTSSRIRLHRSSRPSTSRSSRRSCTARGPMRIARCSRRLPGC